MQRSRNGGSHTPDTRLQKGGIFNYDSYTIIRYGIPSEQLFFLSKVGLLLYDRLMLPAAFFWQSPAMQSLLLKLEPAIANGLILPVIRDYETTIDIRDYFDRRMDESEKLGKIKVFQQPALASEIASPQNNRYVKLLEDINTYAHLDQNSIRAIYVDNWRNDLTNHFDINSLRLLLAQSSIPSDQLPLITEVLLDSTTNPQFSRASSIELIQKIIPRGRCQELLTERTSWLYLKSNADAYGCGMYYSRNPYNGMIYLDNLQLLAQTLGIFGLTEEIISQLSIEDILRVKVSPEYRRFINAYRNLISTVYSEQDRIVSQINNRILFEIKKETHLTALYNALNIIQSTSSSFFMALVANHFSGSSISIPLLIGSGATTIVSSILRRIDAVNNAIESRDFSNFQNYILAEKYKNKFNLTH